ncbi:hypothetical protein [Flectobacillus longus]|uniref:hypothetical protein n=1 Tax=Flectobacillus longus TaxID=2984207 RepID=UPI0024B7A2CE|nr:hypothetical protein [Flectobacillus longus]MDI9879956.1 hypothetical protein [Flectobacillus longus]
MTLGILFLIFGAIVFIFFKDKNSQQAPQKYDDYKPDYTPSTDHSLKYEKGEAFEKYVVQKFSRNLFRVKEWRGDKFVNGQYAETTTYPDLTFEFSFRNITQTFAVECKYRSDYYRDGIEWCKPYQLENYKHYAQRFRIPVFVVIGVGYSPYEPDELFVIPLKALQDTFVTKYFLKGYQKYNFHESNFYFDPQTRDLR